MRSNTISRITWDKTAIGSTSAPTTTPRRFAWCAPRWAIRRVRTGRISCPSATRVTVESVHAFRDYLAIEERDRGLSQIRIHHFPSSSAHYIEFPEPVYSAGLGSNAEFDTRLLRFHYTSLVTPSCVFDYDMETRQRELKKQQEVLGGYDPAQYQSERVYAKAPDGTEVPISVVYKKGFRAEWRGAPAALRLRLLRHQHRSDVQLGPAQPARPRDGVRDRAHSRRRRSR